MPGSAVARPVVEDGGALGERCEHRADGGDLRVLVHEPEGEDGEHDVLEAPVGVEGPTGDQVLEDAVEHLGVVGGGGAGHGTRAGEAREHVSARKEAGESLSG